METGTGKEKQKNGNVVFGASHIECKALNENRKTNYSAVTVTARGSMFWNR